MARNIARHTTSNDEPQDETTGEIRQVPGGSPGCAGTGLAGRLCTCQAGHASVGLDQSLQKPPLRYN